jgi:hypothetical protein
MPSPLTAVQASLNRHNNVPQLSNPVVAGVVRQHDHLHHAGDRVGSWCVQYFEYTYNILCHLSKTTATYCHVAEEPEPDVMSRLPRDPKKPLLVRGVCVVRIATFT